MENEYQDLSDLPANGEAFNPEELQTSDYSDYEVTAPGKYISHERKITFKKKDDGNITFRLEFVGGLTDEQGRKVFRPDVTWASTKKFSRFNRPGQTSQVAMYLRSVGFDMDQVESLKDTMDASANIPVGVIVGLEDKGKQQADGSWKNFEGTVNGKPQKGLRTKDFVDANGRFTPQVMIDGETYTAKPKVQSFFKLR